MAIEVYLVFNGNCREAVEFYAEVFKTETPQIMTFGEAPPHPDYTLPEEAKNLVMHTNLHIRGSRMMFSDTFPVSPFTQGNNFSVTLVDRDVDYLKEVFHALREGGKVIMDLQETFWSNCYGAIEDKFGVNWQISHTSSEEHH